MMFNAQKPVLRFAAPDPATSQADYLRLFQLTTSASQVYRAARKLNTRPKSKLWSYKFYSAPLCIALHCRTALVATCQEPNTKCMEEDTPQPNVMAMICTNKAMKTIQVRLPSTSPYFSGPGRITSTLFFG